MGIISAMKKISQISIVSILLLVDLKL